MIHNLPTFLFSCALLDHSTRPPTYGSPTLPPLCPSVRPSPPPPLRPITDDMVDIGALSRGGGETSRGLRSSTSGTRNAPSVDGDDRDQSSTVSAGDASRWDSAVLSSAAADQRWVQNCVPKIAVRGHAALALSMNRCSSLDYGDRRVPITCVHPSALITTFFHTTLLNYPFPVSRDIDHSSDPLKRKKRSTNMRLRL